MSSQAGSPAIRRGPMLLLALALLGAACGESATYGRKHEEGAMDELAVESPAFANGAAIPARYTCDGEDVSPPLSWSAGPEGTVSYALVMDDPDAPAGTWVHWVAWNLAEPRLAPAIQADSRDVRQGTNSWNRKGYGGPCPPSGTHRYFFRVYALEASLELPPATDKEGLLAAMGGKVLAQGELMGRYGRR